MSHLNDQAIEALSTGARLAHMVTINSDGSPQVTVVWCTIRDGKVVTAHLALHQKLKNLRADSRVSISVISGDRNTHGLAEYIVVNGTAEITEGGAVEVLSELAERYLGPGVAFPPPGSPEGFLVHITPTSIGGVGDWSLPE